VRIHFPCLRRALPIQDLFEAMILQNKIKLRGASVKAYVLKRAKGALSNVTPV